jgi:translation initiation factor IF-2
MLLKHKQVVTPNSMLDEDTLVILAVEFDRDIKFVKIETSEDTMVKEAEVASSPESLVHRPPVVVVMGHVDHGKTSLLDYIRKADVAAHEAGGITQHIGAYNVTLPTGKKITFFDTPGHEAFTEMRRRGAKVTDIVVLVVAADDGVMPQTIEAIDHAKAAEVPIAVAITKADKVGFAQERIDKVKQQLSQHGILVTGWGGDVETFPVASTGTQAGKGIDKLLEHLVLVAEVEDLRADPARNATGTVVEAENNPGRGVLATLLVDQGTLRRGDALVAGSVWGRVRSMRDDKGQTIEEAPPGTPVEITGLDEVPEVGKPFFVRSDANEAREIAEERRARERELELAAQAKPASVENLFSQIEQEKVKTLKIILKTDVQGSLEAIRARLDALGNAEVKVRVIRAGVGAVSESDITMAATYNAQVVGFHVVADETARMKAKHLGVEIRMYRIIYELEEALHAILEGKLSPEARETILGHAEVLQIFRSTKLGNIAGCRVRDGLIRRDAAVRLSRDGIVVWEGRIGSLRREKDDAREVKEGFECGIRLEGYDDIKEGDVVEAYSVEQVARTLAS